jgi:hypothetical protein
LLDFNVLAHHITVFTETIEKPLIEDARRTRAVHEISDMGDFSILSRVRRDGPHRQCLADNGDKLAPPHGLAP